MTSQQNKRIAKNTAILYVRMILLMLISFYTSRLLLSKLGVEDFGVYHVVGGVVVMFNSIRGLFATSTQRFFNIALGENNAGKLESVFQMSLMVNLLIGLVFVLAGEGFGLWFIHNQLNIPPDRLHAAVVVFHFSILASLVTIMNTTYDAAVIAHERMTFYSYLSLGEALLKLGIIFLLSLAPMDRLILYAALLCVVSFVNLFCNAFYCSRKIGLHFRKTPVDRPLLKDMLTFSGWNFFGNFMYSMVNEGINFLLNIFGGVVLNSARAIAYQVRNAIMMFLSNMQMAAQPQLIQCYGQQDYGRFRSLLSLVSRLLFTLFVIIAIPVFFYTPEILGLWLTTVPEGTDTFIKALLVYMMVRSLHGPIDLFFKAHGRLKTYQLTETLMFTLPLVSAYFLLKNGAPAFTVFLAMGAFEAVNFALILVLAGRYNLSAFVGYKTVVLGRLSLTVVSAFILNAGLHALPAHYLVRLMLSVACTACVALSINFTNREKKRLFQFVANHKHKTCHL